MPDRHDGPLAEFAALRREIDGRTAAQQQIFALQFLTAVAVFVIALWQPLRAPLLLILPFSSYLLCTRLLAQIAAVAVISEYVREKLEPVVEGLGWERYRGQVPHPFPFSRLGHPNLLLFAVVPGVAMSLSLGSILTGASLAAAAALLVLWAVAALVTIYVAHLTWTSATGAFVVQRPVPDPQPQPEP